MRRRAQIAGDGVATVLLADHQTTGGYPKIATIISDDLDGFVQLRSRSQVDFERITPMTAIEATRTRRRWREQFLARLRGRPDYGQDHSQSLVGSRW
jgi:allophanate hydrolase subunit 2